MSGTHFLGEDGTSKWHKHISPKDVKTCSENILVHSPDLESITRKIFNIFSVILWLKSWCRGQENLSEKLKIEGGVLITYG